MDVTPLIRDGQQIIQSYAAGLFKVSGISYDHAIIVMPQQTTPWHDAPRKIEDLTLNNFQTLLTQSDDIDVVLFGTGTQMKFIPPSLRQELSAAGLPLDIMDTGAACRTYNVLMAEGRRVAAICASFKPRF